MPLLDLSYTCSNCDKSVFNIGVIMSSNGSQEGFCSYTCAYKWLDKNLRASAKKKEPVQEKLPRTKKH